jgi:hypothetical protein
MVVPLEICCERSQSAHLALLHQPFTSVIMPILRDARPCAQRGVQ